MSDNLQVSQPVTKSESLENKRATPKIFLAILVVGAVAICGVLALGAKFVFH